MMTEAAKSPSQKGKYDKFIPWYFVAFFVVLAILDGIFVYVATITHTGVVTENAYQEGLDYNETITASAKQEALGWTSEIMLEGDIIKASLQDAEGEALVGAEVKALFIRPVVSGKDFTVTLNETGEGLYQLPVTLEQGQWNVRIFVEWKQHTYQAAKRLVAKQN